MSYTAGRRSLLPAHLDFIIHNLMPHEDLEGIALESPFNSNAITGSKASSHRSAFLNVVNLGLSICGIPSRGGPPENSSLKGTVCLLKSVFQPIAEIRDDLSSSSKFGSGSMILVKESVSLGALVPSVPGDGVGSGPRDSAV